MISDFVEIQTRNPIAGNSLGRRPRTSIKNGAEQLVALTKSEDAGPWLKEISSALWVYADVYSNRFIESLCINPDLGMDAWPTVLKNMSATEAREAGSLIWKKFDSLENFNLKIRKVLANVLARELQQHGAIALPPPVTEVCFEPGIKSEVMMFHLTVGQAEGLLGTKWPTRTNRLKPHVLESPLQLAEIALKLGEQMSGFDWRLLTVEEWKQLAQKGKYPWPWGAQPPKAGQHANLRFVEPSAQKNAAEPKYRPLSGIPQGPTEVGLFLPGRSPDGIFDLIGNVYDLVWDIKKPSREAWNSLLRRLQSQAERTDKAKEDVTHAKRFSFKNDFRLAGGAFTSSYIDGERSSLSDTSPIGRRSAGNIGLRFIKVKNESL